MKQDQYKFKVSPENLKTILVKVDYSGVTVGVYSGMTQVLTSGPNGSSLLTGLTINLLLTQDANDSGYYSTFDGAVIQKDVISNFIFSSTTQDPYTYYVYNTSDEFQKFVELSPYILDWGDGSPKQTITTYSPNSISHTYAVSNTQYVITLEQTNPWGTTRVSKKITTPFINVIDPNPNGTAYFTPLGGNWSGTPLSYDYIFSGDAINEKSKQTSNNYTQVPFTISGTTRSRLNELRLYGTQPILPPLFSSNYQVGVPVIQNGQVWGSIINAETGLFTAYTIQNVTFYDYEDGITVYFEQSSGLTESMLVEEPITKDEMLLKVMDQPQIRSDVFVERGKNSAYERVLRLGEVDNLGSLLRYGYGFFNVEKKS